tara:strand:- start:529 stop:936 length:408 start_codon:yes stop_codon:yes gene_type:complete
MNLFSVKDVIGFKIHKTIIPQINIVVPIGLKISKIEKPIFLMEINSLFDIKFLYKNAIDIITINGIVSFITDGNFKIDKYKKEFNLLLELSIILDISKIFINKINIETIKVFINKYFRVNLDKYLLILLIMLFLF